MLEIKYVRQNLSDVQSALKNRNDDTDLKPLEEIDADRRSLLLEIEDMRHHRNVVSEQIAGMKKQGENTDELVTKMRDVSQKIKELDKSLAKNEEKVKDILIRLPNIPSR